MGKRIGSEFKHPSETRRINFIARIFRAKSYRLVFPFVWKIDANAGRTFCKFVGIDYEIAARVAIANPPFSFSQLDEI